MNAVGIGTTVGLGSIIGLGIVQPNIDVAEYIITFAFYGLLSGFLFEMYRMALKDWKPPFLDR